MITDPIILDTLSNKPGRLCILVDVDWPSGQIFAHNRAGQRYWDGQIWEGVGQFINFGSLVSGTKTGRLQLGIQVAQSTLVHEAVRDDAIGRTVKLYLASFDENMRINAAQLIAYKVMAEISIKYGLVNTISIACGSHRERNAGAKSYNRLTKNGWRNRYPDDAYCDDVELLSKGPLSSYSGAQAIGAGSGGSGARGGIHRNREL